MIAFPTRLVRDLLLAPQEASSVVVPGTNGLTTAVVLEPSFTGDAATFPAQAAVLWPRSSRVTSWQIGGAASLEHVVDVIVRVEHGDPDLADAIRDAIVLELVLRCLTSQDDLTAVVDTDSPHPQDVASVTPSVDYTPLNPDDLAAYATVSLTFAADVEL